MKSLTISIKDICQEFSGKLGTITYYSVTFTKEHFPKTAAKKAMAELSKLGVLKVNVYDKKPKEFSVEQKKVEQYLTESGVSFKPLLEPTVKIEKIS